MRKAVRLRRATHGPDRALVEAALPAFVGAIEQVPPRYSAIKIAGERAYDLARDGEVVELVARPVQIDHLSVVEHTPDRTVIAAECGKGTYVRAIARDLGRVLGCYGHVSALRRTRVGPFAEAESCLVATLEEGGRMETPHISVRWRLRLMRSFRWPSHGTWRYGSCGANPSCCGDKMPPRKARPLRPAAASSWP